MPAGDPAAILAGVSDERLRTLERTWRRTQAQADLEALLRERLRAGALTRERLHLAAWVGDPAAQAVYEPPSEEALDRLLAPARFDGVEAEVAARWAALRERLARWPDARLIVEAARTSPLAALVPLHNHYVGAAVAFCRCTAEPEHAVVVTLLRGGTRTQATPRPFVVRTDAGEQVVETLEEAVALAAREVPAGRPVWRGDRHALRLDRLRAGALDEPSGTGALLLALALWDGDAQARGAHALLAAASDKGVDVVARALRAWLQGERGAREALSEAGARVHDAFHYGTSWALALAEHAATLPARPLPDWLDTWRLPDDEALRARVRDAVAPWALGLGDPLAG